MTIPEIDMTHCFCCKGTAHLRRENSTVWCRLKSWTSDEVPDPTDTRTTHDSLAWCGRSECVEAIDKAMLVPEPKNPDGSRSW